MTVGLAGGDGVSTGGVVKVEGSLGVEALAEGGERGAWDTGRADWMDGSVGSTGGDERVDSDTGEEDCAEEVESDAGGKGCTEGIEAGTRGDSCA